VHAWVQPRGPRWVDNADAEAAAGRTLLADTCLTERRTRAPLRAVGTRTVRSG